MDVCSPQQPVERVGSWQRTHIDMGGWESFLLPLSLIYGASAQPWDSHLGPRWHQAPVRGPASTASSRFVATRAPGRTAHCSKHISTHSHVTQPAAEAVNLTTRSCRHLDVGCAVFHTARLAKQTKEEAKCSDLSPLLESGAERARDGLVERTSLKPAVPKSARDEGNSVVANPKKGGSAPPPPSPGSSPALFLAGHCRAYRTC